MADLLPGGQFASRWQEWLTKKTLRPQVLARVSSFTDLARVVQIDHAAAVLSEMAAVDFDPKRFKHEKIDALKPRTLVLIANARSLDRSGITPGTADILSKALSSIISCHAILEAQNGPFVVVGAGSISNQYPIV